MGLQLVNYMTQKSIIGRYPGCLAETSVMLQWINTAKQRLPFWTSPRKRTTHSIQLLFSIQTCEETHPGMPFVDKQKLSWLTNQLNDKD